MPKPLFLLCRSASLQKNYQTGLRKKRVEKRRRQTRSIKKRPPGGLKLTLRVLGQKPEIEFSDFCLVKFRSIFHSSVVIFPFRRKIILKIFWNSEGVAQKRENKGSFGCLVSVFSISSPHGHLSSSKTLFLANVSFILAFLLLLLCLLFFCAVVVFPCFY